VENVTTLVIVWDFHGKKLGACTMWPGDHVMPVGILCHCKDYT